MCFEPYVTVGGPYSKIQDLKTNMEDSKTMIWRKGGSWVEEEGEEEEEEEQQQQEGGGGLVNQWRINLYHVEKTNQTCLSSTLFVH